MGGRRGADGLHADGGGEQRVHPEDGDNDDDESTIADELGWLLDPDTGDRVVTAEGEYLWCRNCTNGDGDNPECKDNYEETRDGEDEDDDEDDDDDDEEDDGEEE